MAKNLDKESFENTVDVEITQESEPSVDVEFWQKESGLKQVELEIIKKEYPNNIDLELWQDEKEIINVEITNGQYSPQDIVHDDTLKGSGVESDPLGVADTVLQNIESRVEKTSEPDKIYGTDSQGEQTVYDKDSFGKVDDVLVDGESVVENKIARIDLTGKVDKVSTQNRVYGTDGQGNQTTYDKNDFGKVDDVKVNGVSVVENKIANVTVPTKTSDITNDSGFITKSVDDLDNYTKTSDLPDVIDNTTSTSTTDALSANQGRVLQSEIESLQGRGRFLSVWNSATGLAETNPPSSPYQYHNGDYFIVGTVAESGGTNYKPDGSSYTTGVASTTVETETVAVNDTYLYDGTVWHLQQNAQRETTFANVAGSPYDNQNLATALNSKANASALTEHINDTNNPHSVTKAQVGLGNVDNTSDLNKPISTATQTALNGKQDVILDLATIRSGAGLGATALQPNDNISELNNDSGYTTNVGTVTSVNNVQPDENGNVTITIPSSDVTDVEIYGVSKVTSGVANLNVVEQVTSLPLSDVWMGRTVQYVGPDYPSNDIYRGYYYIYETRPYGDHMSRTGWWQLDVQPGGAAVNDGTLTIQKNGTQVGTFTANQSTNSTINITVPTNTGDLTNNSGFITSSDIPVTDVTVGGTSVVTSGVAVVPAIPTVNNSTITLTQGGTTKGTFTLNQSSGTTINFDAGQVIQVDASTMPDASTCPGRIVQWVGNTSSMTGLTKGYFYISGTHIVYNATITAENWSPSYTSIIADFFINKFKQVIGRNPEFDEDIETIYFLYDGSKWNLVDVYFGSTTTISDVTLSEYGVTATGTPTNGSKLNIVPTIDFVSSWNRLNVQPDNGATVVYDAINEELTIS